MRPATTARAQPSGEGDEDGDVWADPATVVIGIDLGGTKTHGAVVDPHGSIVVEQIYPTTPDGAYDTVLRCLTTLRNEAMEGGLRVAALGLGVPAVVEPGTGVVSRGPNVGWDGFGLGDRLTTDVDLPVVVENDADLAAVGEARKGVCRPARDFVVVSIGTGVGAAVVVDGRLVKGRHNAAGELGSLVLDRAQLGRVTRGGPGTFEYLAAGEGVVMRATTLLASDGARARSSELDPSVLSTAAVFEAALRGDPVAAATVDWLADDVAMALIALVSTLDPGVVIFDGSVGRALAPHLRSVITRMRRHVMSVPALRVSSLKPTATLVGAAVMAAEVVRRGGGESHFGTLARSMVLIPDGHTEPAGRTECRHGGSDR